MEMQKVIHENGKSYGVFQTDDKDNKRQLFIPISPKEKKLQMSLTAKWILSYPEQLVVMVRKEEDTSRYSFNIIRAVPAEDAPGQVRFEHLLGTEGEYSKYEEAVFVLEYTLRLFTTLFYDELANDKRYTRDGFVMLNNDIVEWILNEINEGKVAWVKNYFGEDVEVQN